MIHSTVWVDSDEFVIKFSVANFAHTFVSDDEIRLFELVGLLLSVECLLVGKLTGNKSVFSLRKSSVKHVDQIRNDVVFARINIPFIWQMRKYSLMIQQRRARILLQKL